MGKPSRSLDVSSIHHNVGDHLSLSHDCRFGSGSKQYSKSDRFHRAWSHPPIEVQEHSEESTISGKPNIAQLFLFMQQPVDIPQCLL